MGPWRIISELSIQGSAITDSWGGNGFYAPYCDVHITTSAPVSLSSENDNYLAFWSHLQTEYIFDECTVQVSSNGTDWETIWVKHGYHANWQQEIISLAEYSGQSLYFRFRLTDDSPDIRLVDPGWTIDEMKIISGYNSITSTEDIHVPAPIVRLKQNYPNPFNPRTTFAFNIENTKVESASLKIYNIKGRLVENISLSEENIKNGTVVWNAENRATGVYLYKLIVNNQDYEVRKALLLK